MRKPSPKGTINKKQSIWTLVIGVVTGILHAILQSKGVLPPSGQGVDPEFTGTAASLISAAIFLKSGPKDQQK